MKKAIKNKEDELKPIIVKDINSSRRLFTRVLTAIQNGTIADTKAKLLIYGLSTFVNNYKDMNIENAGNTTNVIIMRREDS